MSPDPLPTGPRDQSPSPARRLRIALRLALVAVLAGAAALAGAQSRPIADDAHRGVIRHQQAMVLDVDGTLVRLAPGGTIRNRDNLIIVPTALPAEGALADYVLDLHGQISRAWLLTEEEARRRKKKPAGN